MSSAELVIVVCLVVLATAHSSLGETDILRPLFDVEWKTPTPRWAIEKILRFAWHLTSIAWLALAAIVAGLGALPVLALMCLISSVMIFVMLRGHLAWPLFLLAGLAALHADGLLSDELLRVGAVVTSAALGAAALVHVYWAFGGSWLFDSALPIVDKNSFRPGPILTIAVAIALAVYAVLVGIAAYDAGPMQARWLVVVGIVILTIRAIGDNKVAGFTKVVRDTKFAIADDRWFTPLIVFLALGATGALLA